MTIEVLMSACKQKSIKELVKGKNINKCLIVNQLMDEEKIITEKDKVMINTKDKGLSKSRNKLIENMNADIGIITDDDITFEKNYEEVIRKSYEQHKDADIIIFNVKFADKVHGLKKYHIYNKITLLGVMSVQITFKEKSIKENNIKFNENFGLKAKFGSGEENIFLCDALKKKLKIIHVPLVICAHPPIETTGEKWTEEIIKTKGAVSYKIFKNFNFIFALYLIITKYKYYKQSFNVLKFVKLYKEGIKEYKKIGE